MKQEIFFPLWIGLLAIGGPFFWFFRDTRLKRRIYPWYITAVLIVFTTYAFGMMAPIRKDQLLQTIGFFVTVMIVGILTVRGTRWCDDCGKMVIDQSLMRIRKHCPRCGAAFDGSPGEENFNSIGRMG